MLRFRLGAVVVALAATLAGAPSAPAARPLQLGLTDEALQDPDPATRAAWLVRARASRASLVIVSASWAAIAPPAPPPGFDATDPADPAYDWGVLDAAVRDAAARGLEILLLVGQAPAWAEGPNRPAQGKAPAGTWKPDPGALGDFGQAVARRYVGGFTDPDDVLAGPLPRVRQFQLWAEPNLSTYLTPQYKRRRPVAPARYRRMLNAFYRGVKGVSEANLVVTGGTAPYGDLPGGGRTQPVRFWRELLCLRGPKLRRARCSDPARFDVMAHHPINVGGPRRHARNQNDASTPDIARLRQILRRAERSGRARGAKRHPIWATELWWDSRPPDPDGVPARKHARWLAEALYVLWRQRVSTVVWFLIRDQAPAGGDYGASVQSGLYLRGGEPKLAQRAFSFPFVGERRSKHRVLLWGKAPAPGRVQIERRRGGGWRTIARVRAPRSRVFRKRIGLGRGPRLRARQSGEASLAWRLR